MGFGKESDALARRSFLFALQKHHSPWKTKRYYAKLCIITLKQSRTLTKADIKSREENAFVT
ncbi:MAG: hypothetical protein PHH84_08020 [Oscillospiraceae bacterium]|nr:hypothetical protein [Oscillospiraceae bacterium]HBT64480.1 hypothetical protein [Oscillospiraceae bacterium]